MTSITWKDAKTGVKSIKIYRSKDKLDKILKSLSRMKIGETYEFHLITKIKTKVTSDMILHSVSYEDEDEKAMFRKYGIIPKLEDYD